MKTTRILSLLLICLSVHFKTVADDWTSYESGKNVYTVVMDSSRNVWFGSDGYVSKYDGSTWTTDTIATTSTSFGYAMTDKTGNVWFPSRGKGIFKYDGTTWTNYTSTNSGLPSNTVSPCTQDNSGNIWFGTVLSSNGGAIKFDGTNWTVYNKTNGLVNDMLVMAIAQDKDNNMWFGTVAGVSKYDGTTWTTYTTADGLVNNQVLSIIQDKSGNMWFGSYGNNNDGGITKYDGTIWTTYTATNSPLVSNNVESIFQDAKGNMWFLTDDGVSKFDGANWKTYTTADGLVSNGVYSGFQDSYTGDIWLGTDKGISKLTLFSANPDTLNFAAKADTTTIKITTYKDWSLLYSSWINLSSESGSGDSTITVTATANTGISARSGVIVLTGTGVTSQTIYVTQAASPVTSVDLETKQAISISPNPVKDAFQVTGIDGTTTLTLSDINGKLLQTRVVTANEPVNVSVLPKGMYIIKLTMDKGTMQQKLIKQ